MTLEEIGDCTIIHGNDLLSSSTSVSSSSSSFEAAKPVTTMIRASNSKEKEFSTALLSSSSTLLAKELDMSSSLVVEEATTTTTTTTTTTISTKKSAAVQMATLQASFAEKTASEMKQIVDWYQDQATNEETDRCCTQRRALPNNPLACIDDDDDATIYDNNDHKEMDQLQRKEDRTPKKSNRTWDTDSEEREEGYAHMYAYTPPSNTTNNNKLSATVQGEEIDADGRALSVNANDGPLPDLISSPTMLDSPMSSSSSTTDSADAEKCQYTSGSSQRLPTASSVISSSREAQAQYEVVQHILETTQYMADIVLEYTQSSSASDREASSTNKHRVMATTSNSTIRRRRSTVRYRYAGTLSPQHHSDIVTERNSSSSPARYREKTRRHGSQKHMRRQYFQRMVAVGVGMALVIIAFWMLRSKAHQHDPPNNVASILL